MAKERKKDSAHSYEELAGEISRRLGISLSAKAIQNWRKDPRYKDHCPRPRSGRHHVPSWIKFILRFGLKRADETVVRDEVPEERRTIRDWKEDAAKVDYERTVFKFEVEKRKFVELDEICVAVGQMLAGFRTAINMLPGSAARWLIGLKDFHAIKSKLESEVDGVLQSLGRCKYLEFSPCEKCAPHFIKLGKESIKELQIDVD